MKSAKKLLQFDFDAGEFARRAPKSTTIPLKIRADLERIEREHNSMCNVPKKEDLREIYHLFFNAIRTGRLSAEFDSLRRVRRLAWALTYSEDGLPRIVDTPNLRDALQLIEDQFRLSQLHGVFNALLQAWDAWGAGLLRAFVRRHLENYEGRQRFFQNLRANLAWYCEENGATQLAMSLLRDQVKLSEVWSHLNLPDMRGYGYFGAVGQGYVELNRRLDRESVGDVVTFVKMHGDDHTSRTIVSGIIERLGIDASEDLRQPVQSYIFREWEDPRLAGGDVRWREVSDEAKRIFTKWITEEDLRFFFDVVAQACNDRKFAYRKAFWLAYFEHISFCRPVLRRNVHNLLRNNPQALEYYRERQPARLTGGAPDQHAFIIQMGDHTFVEFSTAGACYVYDDASRPFELGDSEYDMIQLRDQESAENRVIHNNSEKYSWQKELAWWIKRELGIEPLRSYRLDHTAGRETSGVAELVQGLGNRRTWQASSRALVEIGRAAVPALVGVLHDADPRVRFRAINTLGEMGGVASEAIPILRELRVSDRMDYVRERAESVLRRIQRSI